MCFDREWQLINISSFQFDADRDEEEVFSDISMTLDSKLFPFKSRVAGECKWIQLFTKNILYSKKSEQKSDCILVIWHQVLAVSILKLYLLKTYWRTRNNSSHLQQGHCIRALFSSSFFMFVLVWGSVFILWPFSSVLN